MAKNILHKCGKTILMGLQTKQQMQNLRRSKNTHIRSFVFSKLLLTVAGRLLLQTQHPVFIYIVSRDLTDWKTENKRISICCDMLHSQNITGNIKSSVKESLGISKVPM